MLNASFSYSTLLTLGLALQQPREKSVIMDYTIDLENEPTLEEDMARFPDKTKDEARQARKSVTLAPSG